MLYPLRPFTAQQLCKWAGARLTAAARLLRVQGTPCSWFVSKGIKYLGMPLTLLARFCFASICAYMRICV
jgi:hypothetical protein